MDLTRALAAVVLVSACSDGTAPPLTSTPVGAPPATTAVPPNSTATDSTPGSTPGSSTPGDSVPGDSTPGSTPGDSTPGSTPGNSTPTPGNSTPGASDSGDEVTDPSDPTAPFRLLFRDDFDSLDTKRWQLMTHSWGGNLAVFSKESPTVEDGVLKLRLLEAPEGTTSDGEDKSFLGAEVRSVDTLTYGRVRARVRFAKGPAVVSSLVTIYTPWPADDWNELDVEALGKDPNEVQFNAMVYTGPALEPPVTESVSPTQEPHMEELGFDFSADFHEYTIEWTPEGATFSVDGEQRHVWTTHIDKMSLPQNVLLTIWASDSAAWAGAVTEETTGAEAQYDWVELWEYTGAAP